MFIQLNDDVVIRIYLQAFACVVAEAYMIIL